MIQQNNTIKAIVKKNALSNWECLPFAHPTFQKNHENQNVSYLCRYGPSDSARKSGLKKVGCLSSVNCVNSSTRLPTLRPRDNYIRIRKLPGKKGRCLPERAFIIDFHMDLDWNRTSSGWHFVFSVFSNVLISSAHLNIFSQLTETD